MENKIVIYFYDKIIKNFQAYKEKQWKIE